MDEDISQPAGDSGRRQPREDRADRAVKVEQDRTGFSQNVGDHPQRVHSGRGFATVFQMDSNQFFDCSTYCP